MAAYDKADLERRMHGAVEALKHDLSGLRTGRANVSLPPSSSSEFITTPVRRSTSRCVLMRPAHDDCRATGRR